DRRAEKGPQRRVRPLRDDELAGLRVGEEATDHERGTARQGWPLNGSGSRGRPRTRSPPMLRWISDVPPSMELARVRRNIFREDPGGRTSPKPAARFSSYS